MKKIAIAAGLLLLVADGSALAQGAGAGSSAGRSSSPSIQAPVGHRQPRAGDFADEKSQNSSSDQANKEDAALDKKIKSICRGC